jgi:hypothetical protein
LVDIVKLRPIISSEGFRKVVSPLPWTRSMAENESLDLKSPYAQRWNAVRDAARKGASCQKIAILTRKRLYAALRRVRKQFKEYGVSIADFFASRRSLPALRGLLRKTERHPYAEVLVGVLNSSPTSTEHECLKKWGHAILDMVFDGIGAGLVGTERFPSAFESLTLFRQVRHDLEDDVQRIATNLVENIDWEPRQAPCRRVSKEDATAELLPMSLLAGGKR